MLQGVGALKRYPAKRRHRSISDSEGATTDTAAQTSVRTTFGVRPRRYSGGNGPPIEIKIRNRYGIISTVK